MDVKLIVNRTFLVAHVEGAEDMFQSVRRPRFHSDEILLVKRCNYLDSLGDHGCLGETRKKEFDGASATTTDCSEVDDDSEYSDAEAVSRTTSIKSISIKPPGIWVPEHVVQKATSSSPGSSSNGETRTTLIMKNLPAGCSRAELTQVLDSAGFASKYDFLYLPSNMTRGGSYRYAFLNFISSDSAARALAQLNGFTQWSEHLGCPAMQLFWSDIQGQEAYVEKYRNSPVMHESVPCECKPAVFSNGSIVAFPVPTRAIKAPRLRDRSVHINSVVRC